MAAVKQEAGAFSFLFESEAEVGSGGGLVGSKFVGLS